MDSRSSCIAEPVAPPQAQAAITSTPRQRLAAGPQAVRLSRIRGFVRDYLTLYCAEQRAVDDMVLCVGEACTNAVCHSGSAEQIEIFLGFRGDDLRVLVKDRGRGFDTAAFDPEALPDPASERGRGLFLMSQLCDEMTLRADGGLEVLLVMRAVRRAPSPSEGFAGTPVGATLPRRTAEPEPDGRPGRGGLDEALDALDSLVHSTLASGAIMQNGLDEAVRALSGDAGAIELRDETVWVVRCQCGLGAADVGLRLTRSQAPNATRAMAYRQPFATADMRAAATDVGLAATHALRSVLAVPLLSRDVVTGCLLVYGTSVRVFSDAELDFARRLGATLSTALENAGSRGVSG